MLIGDFDNVPNMLLEMNANTKKYFKCLPIIILSHLNVSHIHILGSIRIEFCFLLQFVHIIFRMYCKYNVKSHQNAHLYSA